MQATIELIEPLPTSEQMTMEIERDMRQQDEHDRNIDKAFLDPNTGYRWEELRWPGLYRRKWITKSGTRLTLALYFRDHFGLLNENGDFIKGSTDVTELLSLAESKYS